MTEPERTPHSTESAEGDEPGDDETGGRTPHSEEPAEGEDTDEPRLGLLLRAQLAAQDLAAGRLRHGLDELDLAHPLVRRAALGDEGHDVVLGRRAAGRPDDERLRHLVARARRTRRSPRRRRRPAR